MPYIVMAEMYKTMSSGKVDKFLVQIGDKVKKGMPVAEVIAEGYFTLTADVEGIIKEIYVGEGEYVEVGTPVFEVEEAVDSDEEN